MRVPIKYSYRNLWTRKTTTILTMGGISLVVFVFAAVLMLAYGLKKTLVTTGSEENIILIRKSSNSEMISTVSRDQANLIKTMPEIRIVDGKPLTATELVVVINLQKYATNDMANVIVRGVSGESMKIRPQVKLTEGRLWNTGSAEIIVGRSIAKRFQGCKVGQTLRFGTRDWQIVGIFDAGSTGFESEVWGDVEQMMPAFGRPVFSSLTLQLDDLKNLKAFQARFESEPRLQQLEIKKEKQYYAEQSEVMATFIRVLGLFITIVFSFGAMVGAMITMYASVANRTVEIGTLRALGFRRRNILLAFLLEGLLLSFIGGIVGLFLASFLQAFTISTLNFGTFSELAFGFNLSVSIVFWSLFFALTMGLLGGFLPAVRASRLNIVNALRAS
jgi:ABC-type lipoprotein release transport system permease subunit